MPKSVSYALASLSVFFISGVMHEYIIAVNISWPFYLRYYKGQQVTFFMLQGLGVVFEQLPIFKTTSSILQRVWGLLFIYFTVHYFIRGFVVCDFHLSHPVRFSTPFLKKLILAHPILKPYFGSHI
jgi:hypothetical protein